MYLPHFVLSISADWHLHCFHLLAIMNNADINICVQIPVLRGTFSVLLDIHTQHPPRSGITGSYLIIWGTTILLGIYYYITKQLDYFMFPPGLYEDSDSSKSSPIFVVIWLFYSSHSSGFDLYLHIFSNVYISPICTIRKTEAQRN